jgi:hypothetical protein
MSLDLDSRLEALGLDMPRPWQYTRVKAETHSEWIYGDHYDTYPGRHVKQTWNVFRLVRILLNESILNHCLASTPPCLGEPLILDVTARIAALACDISASVPQYADCFLKARRSNPETEKTRAKQSNFHHHDNNYQHSPTQKLDCYTLIFPLYVAAQSWNSPSTVKSWAIKQLYHIGEHFDIRNAELVAKLLENGKAINPWSVYAVLGSYAFAA